MTTTQSVIELALSVVDQEEVEYGLLDYELEVERDGERMRVSGESGEVSRWIRNGWAPVAKANGWSPARYVMVRDELV